MVNTLAADYRKMAYVRACERVNYLVLVFQSQHVFFAMVNTLAADYRKM